MDDLLRARVAAAAIERGLVDGWYAPVDTPLGRLLVVETGRGVCRVGFPEEDPIRLLDAVAVRLGPRLVLSREASEPTGAALLAYLQGESASLDVSVDWRLVSRGFRRRVLSELTRVPRGEVVTYSGLARRVGSGRAARAVGSACGSNPVPIVVPCHRVVPADGGIGGYGGGAERKRRLLQLEGVL